MNFLTELFLAWRYFKPKRNAVSVITVISLIGVSVGVCVLMVVLAIMTGFTNEIKTKLISTYPHIQIQNYAKPYIKDPEPIIEGIDIMGANAISRTEGYVLSQFGNNISPQYVIGINPEQESDSNFISKSIISGKYSLNNGEAVVSYVMANQLGFSVGSKIMLHSPAKLKAMVNIDKDGKVYRSNRNDNLYLPSEFTVTGIFNVGEYKFDSKVIITNIDDANALFGYPLGSATMIAVETKDPFNISEIYKTIKNVFPGYQVMTWMQMNKQFLDVLAVEKNMMFFVLVFIVLVAASSITNTLITVVVQKTREIGLLMALGARGLTIMKIFVMQGFFVGSIGTAVGLVLGTVVIYWRNELLHFMSDVFNIEIFPRQFYYLSQLPAMVVPGDVIFISICSVVLCTLGALIPAYRAARLDPAKALRYE
jgi:lipoprotein-releasing system permease protein